MKRRARFRGCAGFKPRSTLRRSKSGRIIGGRNCARNWHGVDIDRRPIVVPDPWDDLNEEEPKGFSIFAKRPSRFAFSLKGLTF